MRAERHFGRHLRGSVEFNKRVCTIRGYQREFKMKSVLTGVALLSLTSTTFAAEDLFSLLDANNDNVVTESEISPAQRPFFLRALRVSDRNEDGALTRDELTVATADPEPTQISTGQNRLRNAAGFDPSRFDANKDGKVAKNEIPAFLRDRMAPLFERFGTEEIAVADLQRVLSYAAPGTSSGSSNNSDPKMSDRDKSMRQMSDRRNNGDTPNAPTRNRVGSMMQQMRQRLQNGRLQNGRLQNGRRQGGMQPDRQQQNRQQQNGRPGAASGGGSATDTFRRMDGDRDGQLSGSEIPERMKTALRRFDRNQDGALSLAEFKVMAENYRRQRENN